MQKKSATKKPTPKKPMTKKKAKVREEFPKRLRYDLNDKSIPLIQHHINAAHTIADNIDNWIAGNRAGGLFKCDQVTLTLADFPIDLSDVVIILEDIGDFLQDLRDTVC